MTVIIHCAFGMNGSYYFICFLKHWLSIWFLINRIIHQTSVILLLSHWFPFFRSIQLIIILWNIFRHSLFESILSYSLKNLNLFFGKIFSQSLTITTILIDSLTLNHLVLWNINSLQSLVNRWRSILNWMLLRL